MFKRQKISLELAQQALAIYRDIPIKFIDIPLETTLDISESQNMYAYDTYLIQCSLQTSTPLLTFDKGLKTLAEKLSVLLLEVKS